MKSERKVAVITGASQGIGAGLVQRFRAIGYGVLANSRSIKTTDFGDDPAILAVGGDIAVPETSHRIIGAAMERFGRIDTLVNNAGIFISKPFVDYTEGDFAAMSRWRGSGQSSSRLRSARRAAWARLAAPRCRPRPRGKRSRGCAP